MIREGCEDGQGLQVSGQGQTEILGRREGLAALRQSHSEGWLRSEQRQEQKYLRQRMGTELKSRGAEDGG